MNTYLVMQNAFQFCRALKTAMPLQRDNAAEAFNHVITVILRKRYLLRLTT